MKLWQSGNVEMRIWSHDHCPPHITATCRADAWTARFGFSMLTGKVSLLDIVPARRSPSRTFLTQLANEVRAKRFRCRQIWWSNYGGVCLDNARVSGYPGGDIVLYENEVNLSPDGWIMPKTGIYRLGIGIEAKVAWGIPVTTEILQER